MPGVEVDGQDVVAVYQAAGEAIQRARAGEGPTLIECRTYRYVGHHEGDPGTDYRTQAEIAEWRKRDPIQLHSERLLADGIATQAELDEIGADVQRVVQDAVDFAADSPWPATEELTTRVFHNPVEVAR